MAYVEHQLGEESYLTSGGEIISHELAQAYLVKESFVFS